MTYAWILTLQYLFSSLTGETQMVAAFATKAECDAAAARFVPGERVAIECRAVHFVNQDNTP